MKQIPKVFVYVFCFIVLINCIWTSKILGAEDHTALVNGAVESVISNEIKEEEYTLSITASYSGEREVDVSIYAKGNVEILDIGLMYQSDLVSCFSASWEDGLSEKYIEEQGIVCYQDVSEYQYLVFGATSGQNKPIMYNGIVATARFQLLTDVKELEFAICTSSAKYRRILDASERIAPLRMIVDRMAMFRLEDERIPIESEWPISTEKPIGFDEPDETQMPITTMQPSKTELPIATQTPDEIVTSLKTERPEEIVKPLETEKPIESLPASVETSISLQTVQNLLKCALGIIEVNSEWFLYDNNKNGQIDLDDTQHALKCALGII